MHASSKEPAGAAAASYPGPMLRMVYVCHRHAQSFHINPAEMYDEDAHDRRHIDATSRLTRWFLTEYLKTGYVD